MTAIAEEYEGRGEWQRKIMKEERKFLKLFIGTGFVSVFVIGL